MNDIRHKLQQLYWRVVDHPFDSIESLLAVLIPLIIVVFIFQWRVKQSFKKQKRIANRREKLMKKLKKYENGDKEEEEDDDVIKEAIKLMEEKAKKLN